MKETNLKKKSIGASTLSKAESNSRLTPDASPTIDETDKRILQVLQDDFPVVQEPWLEVSRRLNITESEVLTRLKRLIDAGVIRKIGPSLNSSAIGFKAATLVALRVPKNKVDQVAAVINEYETVSHNYERAHEFNVWFTLVAPTEADLATTLNEIKQKTGTQEQDLLDLPTVQRFKINVRFQLTS